MVGPTALKPGAEIAASVSQQSLENDTPPHRRSSDILLTVLENAAELNESDREEDTRTEETAHGGK